MKEEEEEEEEEGAPTREGEPIPLETEAEEGGRGATGPVHQSEASILKASLRAYAALDSARDGGSMSPSEDNDKASAAAVAEEEDADPPQPPAAAAAEEEDADSLPSLALFLD